MKVQDPNLTALPVPAARSGASGASGRLGSVSTNPALAAAGGDRVDLSPLSGTVARVLGADAQSRSARTAALSQSYAAGQYAADTARVSHALVSETVSASAAQKVAGSKK